MARVAWEFTFVLVDQAGFLLFGFVTYVLSPKSRANWKMENSDRIALATLTGSIGIVFFWLFLADIDAHMDIGGLLDWISEFPGRGIGLRVLLFFGGLGVFHRLIARKLKGRDIE